MVNPKGKKGQVGGASSSRVARERIGQEIPAGYDFTEWEPPVGWKEPKYTPSRLSLGMNAEGHPWLAWPGATKNEKIGLNNKLAEFQTHKVEEPRLMDWSLIKKLGLTREFRKMMRTVIVVDEEEVEFQVWDRVFRIEEPIYREWCLEFYCSLKVDKELDEEEMGVKKVIHFRLGGVQRHCTVAEFGWLTGMLSDDDMRSPHLNAYLWKGAWDTTGFTDSLTAVDYWKEISRETSHSTKKSKVSNMYSSTLRLFHKFIPYGYLHRSSGHDKAYVDDLWLLRLFDRGAPYRYACAPYYLALYMAKTKDGKLCNGHFITAMVRRLGCFVHDANRDLSHVVNMKVIGRREIQQSGLLVRVDDEYVLIDSDADDEEEDEEDDEGAEETDQGQQGVPSPVQEDVPVQQPDVSGPQSFDFSDWGRQLGMLNDTLQHVETRIGSFDDRIDQFGSRMDLFDERQQQMAAHQLYMGDHQRRMESQLARIEYDQTYFRPFMAEWAERQTEAQHRPMPQYQAPSIFIPTQQYGGFIYPPPQQDSGVGTSRQRPVFPMFGSYSGQHDGDGTPSVFGASDDMQE